MAYDPLSGSILLMGGTTVQGGADTLTGDTWIFHAGAWSQVGACGGPNQPVCGGLAPKARAAEAVTYDAQTGSVVLFGGASSVIQFGGDYPSASQDTWAFGFSNNTTGTWTKLAPVATPPPLWGSSPAIDPVTPGVLLFGGCDPSHPCPLNRTWVFATSNWTEVTAQNLINPPGRSFAGLAYDEKVGYLVLFGGRSQVAVNDTWAYPSPYPPLLVSKPVALPLAIDLGQSTILKTMALGGYPPYIYSWHSLPSGCVSANVANLSCTPQINGTYNLSVVVTDSRGDSTPSPIGTLKVASRLAAIFQTAPLLGPVPLVVRFLAVPTGGLPPYGYLWTLGVGLSTTASNPQRTYPRTGLYPITLRLNDSAGAIWSGNETVTAVLSLLVVVSISPNPIGLGESATFTANITGGVPPFRFVWNSLPPGCPQQNVTVLRCSPTALGAYTVTLSVFSPSQNATSGPATLTVHAASIRGLSLYLYAGVGVGGAILLLVGLVAWSRSRRRRGRPPKHLPKDLVLPELPPEPPPHV